MRDFSPSPLDIKYAADSPNATTPRKSRVSPPGTVNRFQCWPSSFETITTPFEPDAQTTDPPWASTATLTPRRFVSIPEVTTFQVCASAEPTKAGANNTGST